MQEACKMSGITTQTINEFHGDSLDLFSLLQCIRKGPITLPSQTEIWNKILFNELKKLNKISEQEIMTLFDSGWKKGEGVKFLPLSRLLKKEEKLKIMITVEKVLEVGEFTSGAYVSQFAEVIQKFTRMKYAILCSSGTDALIIALKAMGIGPCDEVLIPSNSFAATENAVLICGAKPVLVDVDPTNYLMSLDNIKKKTTAKTKAILPVHLYGNLSNMQAIYEYAQNRQLRVVEDACQAIGVKGVGQFSDCAVLSFNPFKNFAVCGKAGAVVTSDEALALKCDVISYHGFDRERKNYKVYDYGFNSKIDNLQAAIGMVRIEYLAFNNFKRSCLAEKYIEGLLALEKLGEIALPKFQPYNAWHLFPVQILKKSRDEVKRILKENYSVETEIYYPVLTHQQYTPYHCENYADTCLDNTEKTHATILHLPLHHALTVAELQYVIEVFYEIFC